MFEGPLRAGRGGGGMGGGGGVWGDGGSAKEEERVFSYELYSYMWRQQIRLSTFWSEIG